MSDDIVVTPVRPLQNHLPIPFHDFASEHGPRLKDATWPVYTVLSELLEKSQYTHLCTACGDSLQNVYVVGIYRNTQLQEGQKSQRQLKKESKKQTNREANSHKELIFAEMERKANERAVRRARVAFDEDGEEIPQGLAADHTLGKRPQTESAPDSVGADANKNKKARVELEEAEVDLAVPDHTAAVGTGGVGDSNVGKGSISHHVMLVLPIRGGDAIDFDRLQVAGKAEKEKVHDAYMRQCLSELNLVPQPLFSDEGTLNIGVVTEDGSLVYSYMRLDLQDNRKTGAVEYVLADAEVDDALCDEASVMSSDNGDDASPGPVPGSSTRKVPGAGLGE